MNQLEKLSEFIVELKFEEIPIDIIETAKFRVVDSFSAGVGAGKDEMITDIIKEYKSFYKNGNDVGIWGREEKFPLVQAAFLNSLMGHRLELDDVHINSKTHIGTIVVPTALCMADYLKSSGKEFLEAVICGYETMARIGMALGVSSHRNKGWHVTSTAGTFGAAAAAAKLLKLNKEETINALGMAGTQSFGLWAFLEDSASSKILHPARATSSGIEAAMLAKAGMTGPRSILDAQDGGLLQAMSDEYDVSKVSKDLGKVYEIKNVDNKPYPCCRSTHCNVDSAIYLKNKYNIDIDSIDKIEVDTYLVGYKQCGLTKGSLNPNTPTEAKFSTPYVISTALLNGNVILEDFKEDKIRNSQVRELLKKVSVKPNDVFTDRYPEHWGCKTKIKMLDGQELEVEIKDALGSVDNPLSKKQIIKKTTPLLEALFADRSMDIIETMLRIEEFEDLSKLKL